MALETMSYPRNPYTLVDPRYHSSNGGGPCVEPVYIVHHVPIHQPLAYYDGYTRPPHVAVPVYYARDHHEDAPRFISPARHRLPVQSLISPAIAPRVSEADLQQENPTESTSGEASRPVEQNQPPAGDDLPDTASVRSNTSCRSFDPIPFTRGISEGLTTFHPPPEIHLPAPPTEPMPIHTPSGPPPAHIVGPHQTVTYALRPPPVPIFQAQGGSGGGQQAPLLTVMLNSPPPPPPYQHGVPHHPSSVAPYTYSRYQQGQTFRPWTTMNTRVEPNEKDKRIVPNDNDVLCGKGGKTLLHNRHFTEMCIASSKEYAKTNKRGMDGKRGIAMAIVNEIKASNGRFLNPIGDTWEEISDEKAANKVAHCIRDLVRRGKIDSILQG